MSLPFSDYFEATDSLYLAVTFISFYFPALCSLQPGRMLDCNPLQNCSFRTVEFFLLFCCELLAVKQLMFLLRDAVYFPRLALLTRLSCSSFAVFSLNSLTSSPIFYCSVSILQCPLFSRLPLAIKSSYSSESSSNSSVICSRIMLKSISLSFNS